MCQICLQPFVSPVDTPCSHTFCHACLSAYLRVNPVCPLDRKPVNEMTITPSNLVLKRLLDKLPVTCPNSDSCQETLQRGSLSDHLRYRCEGTLVACAFAGAGCTHRGPQKGMAKHRAECEYRKEGERREMELPFFCLPSPEDGSPGVNGAHTRSLARFAQARHTSHTCEEGIFPP